MDNKGQMGMITIIFGIVISIVAVIILANMSGTMVNEWKTNLGACSAMNCKGYIDVDSTTASTCSSTNETYNPDYETNTLGCAVRGFGMGLYLILVLLMIITVTMTGKTSGSTPVGYE